MNDNSLYDNNNDNNTNIEDDLEWEEWDGRSPFLHHCIAGSIAGVAEHTLLYPVDTIKTHMQSYCADCPHNVKNKSAHGLISHPSSAIRSTSAKSAATAADHGMWRTMQNIVLHGNSTTTAVGNASRSSTSRPATNIAATCFPEATATASASASTASTSTAASTATETAVKLADAVWSPKNNPSIGFSRLWRGVQTMAVGCAPAHALYFSSYEAVKSVFLDWNQQQHTTTTTTTSQHHLSPLGSSVAGATATVFHDLIMAPMDTIKQRLQLGHYQGMYNGVQHIVQHEGYVGLYRSFPITLLTNVPYGMVMVSTNEFLKEVLNPDGQFDLESCLLAGCGAGFVASASTTPLDRVKTRLQTQALGSVLDAAAAASVSSVSDATPSTNTGATTTSTSTSTPCGNTRVTKCGRPILLQEPPSVKYEGWRDALKSILREEGYAGLFRGVVPRVMMHSPAVAISWTTYEGAKKWLLTSSD